MEKSKLEVLVSYLKEVLKTTRDKTKARHAKGLVIRITELK